VPDAQPAVQSWPAALARAAVLVSTLVVPAAVATAMAGSWVGAAVLLGSMVAFMGALGAGPDAARAAMPVLVVGGSLGTVALGSSWWVVLVTVLAVIAGLASARGAMPAFSMAALAAVMAPGPATARAALVYALGLAVGAVYGLLLAGRLDLSPPAVDVDVPPLAVAAGLGGATGLAAALAHVVGDPRADWIPLTVLVIAGTALRGSSRRTVDRVVGTLLGVAAAIALSLLGPPSWLLAGLGVIAMVASISAASGSYRWTSLFITLAVVLVATPGSAAVPDLAVRRLGYTVAGAAVLAAGAVVARVVLPHMRRPEPPRSAP
jgi:hypothetical protein